MAAVLATTPAVIVPATSAGATKATMVTVAGAGHELGLGLVVRNLGCGHDHNPWSPTASSTTSSLASASATTWGAVRAQLRNGTARTQPARRSPIGGRAAGGGGAMTAAVSRDPSPAETSPRDF